MTTPAESAPLRRLVYALLITLVAGSVAGRILSANLVYEPYLFRKESDPDDGRRVWPRDRPEPMPTFSSNDRSRWDTIRALVDEGTYAIGRRPRDIVLGSVAAPLGGDDPVQAAVMLTAGYEARTTNDSGIITEDGWQTIDKVLHPDRLEFYSSKPPFLTTLVAGEYWLLKQTLGWSIVRDRWKVVYTTLLTVNLLPMLLYLALLARLLDRFGTTDWGRLFVFAAACFATFLTTFAITLNNHSVATCAAVFALYPAVRIWESGAGELAGGSRLNFALAGFFAAFTACTELPAAAFAGALFVMLLVRAPGRTLTCFVPAAAVPVAAFFLTNYLAVEMWRPAYSEFGGPWYAYEGSHWRANPGQEKQGIDWAGQKESGAAYAFHFLFGHHGIFSLSPIYLLAVAGMLYLLFRRNGPADPRQWRVSRVVAGLTLVVSVVVIGFYLIRTTNYGGWTSGPRWVMWLSPLWLLMVAPAADWLAVRRWTRGLAYALLGLSVLSVNYPAWNAWRHPWLYNWMEALGWLKY
jgi:hypothetical protein